MARSSVAIGVIILLVILMSLLSYLPAPGYEIKYPSYFGDRIFIPADNPTTEAGVKLGRMLFYETSLSKSNTISCATCHQQQLSFTDGKKFSTGVDGTMQKRNTMSLANLLWVRNFFWDGRAAGLEEQAKTPLTDPHEMGQSLQISAKKLRKKQAYPSLFKKAFNSDTIKEAMIVKALAQFQRTLVSAESRYDKYLRGEYKPTVSELNGIALFYAAPDPIKGMRGADCAHCHGGPKTYTELFQNNGLDSIPSDRGRELFTGNDFDRGRFRVATLRNIALTAPYMHDGRFNTLEEVVDHYNEHVSNNILTSPFLRNRSNELNGKQLGLTNNEKKDILAFLHMLTDSSFISNKNFSNPFSK
ncbi:cytochrome-c peroxidase [Pollutibacter soli]|uniref:cytochrome-c peroxidase n=1 Tax=Pollutibacter soli TaxID=3034157 RepID=UPI003013F9DD